MILRRTLLVAVLAFAALLPVTAQAASGDLGATARRDPAAVPLSRATELAADWGLCATARPAKRLLAIAWRTRAPRPRVKRAVRALHAWRAVVRECSKPVPQPIVVVPPAGYLPEPTP